MTMAKGSNTVVRVSGLRRAFGSTVILDRFNLQVREGEAIALTGRNGAGKSTLLRLLVGADKADEGTIEVCGTPMTETSAAIRRDMATVIDDLDFFPDLSVVEHLDLLARAHGVENPDPLVDEVLEEVQLVPQSGQLPGTLSSGQRRRLALATAFVRPRRLLILDEPEQRLDVEGVTWLANRLKNEREQGLAIIFASHEPRLVQTVATRVVTLGAPRAGAENLLAGTDPDEVLSADGETPVADDVAPKPPKPQAAKQQGGKGGGRPGQPKGRPRPRQGGRR
ncbi:ABC-type multidrug transport system ATPase subunit [Friedmanniella endophytica]|uniref:ABC-type multidrug transport system ATPase subunit n=1 Tax=Microlunatus kandeliicorticis TaxID=1759536 RepID=A0A7W3IPC8_9ACTN|nr:ABC-type multidrug transport system ATPase subunit [Microlunatus kandeliicorticis]